MKKIRSVMQLLILIVMVSCKTVDLTQSTPSNSSTQAREFLYDFSKNEGDYGFKALFRDVPESKYREFVRRYEGGLDLGPIPPESENHLLGPDHDSHWLMNAGVYPVADNPGLFGYLLQGVNRSDDMDKYIVREFGPKDGLQPNSDYTLTLSESFIASNDAAGAFGPGGGPARLIDVYVVDKDPHPFVVDFNKHVRFEDDNKPSFAAGRRGSFGATAVCTKAGSGLNPVPGLLPACSGTARIPFRVIAYKASSTLSIKTNDQGSFWLMIGGHSGHESLDDYFIIKFKATISGPFTN